MGELDPIVREFLAESQENLEQVDRDLVNLEGGSTDQGLLDRVFRAIHTIKGTCGFLGFGRLEALSHAGESLLGHLRDRKRKVTPDISAALMEMVDALRSVMQAIERTGSDERPGVDLDGLMQRLTDLAPVEDPGEAGRGGGIAGEGVGSGSGSRSGGGAEGKVAVVKEGADSFVRVDVRVLDRLMDLAGELVLVRNQLVGRENGSRERSPSLQQLDGIVGELQDAVMRTRLQPVSRIWGRFPRLVRDLAAACGKMVKLQMEGGSTELDRSLIEAIRDPLTHLVRNAVDHGIEAPDCRLSAGKPLEGLLWLRAYHEAGKVVIEVGDDGAGIDTEAVLERAVERGLVSPDAARTMGPGEIEQLIFRPGFTTTETVSHLSGRGVGLDVVRTNIERLNGHVEVETTPGEGTVFRLTIPLTLAILQVVVVECAGQRFTIPQVAICEMIRPGAADSGPGIEMVHGAPVFRVRGRLLTLVDLGVELGLREEVGDDGVIVVAEADGGEYGLIVDRVFDTQEIVVKPLGRLLEHLSVYAGATIMGDGRVALILDVPGLAQRTNLSSEETVVPVPREAESVEEDLESWLVFRSPDNGRMAVPLHQVVRLEHLPGHTVEHLGGSRAIQYRGDMLPLVFVFDHLEERRKVRRVEHDGERAQNLVVYEHGGGTVGLVVGRVLDIVKQTVAVRRPSSREGIVECAVIRDRLTEILDVDWVVRAADPPVLGPPSHLLVVHDEGGDQWSS